jgi:hypothetical protein
MILYSAIIPLGLRADPPHQLDLETPPRNKKKKKEKHQKMFSVNFWHSPLRRQSAADCIRPISIHLPGRTNQNIRKITPK